MNVISTEQLDQKLHAGVSVRFLVEIIDVETNMTPDLTGCAVELVVKQKDVEKLKLDASDITGQLTFDPLLGHVSIDLKPDTSVDWLGSHDVYCDMSWPDGHNARLFFGIWLFEKL